MISLETGKLQLQLSFNPELLTVCTCKNIYPYPSCGSRKCMMAMKSQNRSVIAFCEDIRTLPFQNLSVPIINANLTED